MNSEARAGVHWAVLTAFAIGLVGAGAGATYLWLRPSLPAASPAGDHASASGGGAPHTAPAVDPAPAASGAAADAVVTLSPEASARAGITTVVVAAGNTTAGVKAPGVVEANAYKQVVVTPTVSGRITRVPVDLGQHVRAGQTLAEIFSPELAEVQTRYISARAELDAHEQELARTEKLVEIGAASRQELERIHADHTARRADLESAASRLQLLGMSAQAIAALGPGRGQRATTNVPAPMGGVITERLANVGLNVDQATKLFTVVDLSSVWVVVNLYEQDFGRVRVGSPAAVTTAAYPTLRLEGRVSYIDPQVSPETRTARARIEVPNARNELRLGMYAEAMIGGEGNGTAPVIPRSAVQNVGGRTVVYLLDPKTAGRYLEREVRLGAIDGDRVAVLSGVQNGDRVVAEGSFSVRAERERVGAQSSPAGGAAVQRPAAGGGAPPVAGSGLQEARVTVKETGFDPDRLTLRAGVPARIIFTRTTDKTCATEVDFPSLKLRRDLPLNEPVVIAFTPDKAGEVAFVCGMNMLRGAIVIQ